MQSTWTVHKTIRSPKMLVSDSKALQRWIFHCMMLMLPTPNQRFHSSILHSSQECRSRATTPAGYMLHLLPAECPAQAEVQRAKNRDAIQKASSMSIKVCAWFFLVCVHVFFILTAVINVTYTAGGINRLQQVCVNVQCSPAGFDWAPVQHAHVRPGQVKLLRQRMSALFVCCWQVVLYLAVSTARGKWSGWPIWRVCDKSNLVT